MSVADAFALLPRRSSTGRDRGPGVVGIQPQDISVINDGDVALMQECTSRSQDISLTFFDSIINNGSLNSISLKNFDPEKKTIKINIPSYKTNCMKLIPIVSKVFTDGDKQFARIILRNVKDLSSYEGNSMEAKIESCLTQNGLLGETGWENNVEYQITEPQVISATLKGKDIDNSKQLGIVFGSPADSPYIQNGDVKITQNSVCHHDEDLGVGLTSLRDEQTAKDNRIINLCESLNLDEIQLELESQAKLEPYQSNLLYNVLRQAQEKFVEEKLQILDSVGKEILEAESYDIVKDLGFQYLSVLEELEQEIILPSKEELIKLAASLQRAKTTDEKRQIHADINKLTELIGAISNTSRSRVLPQVLDKLLEYGQEEIANKAALISIKSNEYAKSKRYIETSGRASRARSVSRIFNGIDKLIESEYRSFSARSEEARVVYEQRTGLSKLSPQVKSELDRLVRIRDQRFDAAVTNIQRELAKCQKNFLGIMIAPISCKNAMKNQNEWYREALSEKERYNQQISKLAAKYSFYSNLENQASKMDINDPLGRTEQYRHQSSNYLGSYGVFNDYGSSGSGSSDLHKIEKRDLTLGQFNVGARPSYSSYFSAPSRVNPYATFRMPSQAGYSFR